MNLRSEQIASHALDSRMKYTLNEARTLLYNMINTGDIKESSWLHKHLFFEMYPLVWLSEYLEGTKWIKFCGAMERYDGEIKFQNNPYTQKIEFVRAVDSEEEAIKDQISKIQETIPGFKIMDDSPSRKTIKILKEIKWLWKKALNRKAEKNKKRGQYNGVWLGIIFDDSKVPLEDRRKLDKRARKFCRKNVRAINKVFRRVFLIGLSGIYIFDSDEALGSA